jgi:uncharacterized protein (DUF58 family)
MKQPDHPPHVGPGWRLPLLGLGWLITAGLLLAAGLFKAVNLLTLLACCLLAALLLNGLLSGGLRRLKSRRRLLGPLVAGQPCPVVVETANAGRPLVGVRLEDSGPNHFLHWFADRLPGGASAFRGSVVLPRRGRYMCRPVMAERGHPFGLVLRRRELGPAEEWIVWPRLGALNRARFRRRIDSSADPLDRSRARPRPHPAAQAGFYGLRPYRPGDSPRSIHWRSSARRGELLVREFEDYPGEDLILILDASGAGEAFEAAVSLAATVCREWCRFPGGRLTLVLPGAVPAVLDGPTSPTHERRLLDRLAVEPGGAAIDVARLTRELAAARLPPGPAVLISAGPRRLAEATRRALRRPSVCLDVMGGGMEFYQPPSQGPTPASRMTNDQ